MIKEFCKIITVFFILYIGGVDAQADDFTDLVFSVLGKSSKDNHTAKHTVSTKRYNNKDIVTDKKTISVNFNTLTQSMIELTEIENLTNSYAVNSTLDHMSVEYAKKYAKSKKSVLINPIKSILKLKKPEELEFIHPVNGKITSRFGFRPSFGRMHKGVDISLNVGDTVRAAMDGVVSHIGYDYNGYGNYIILKHSDGMETLYGHLKRSIVVAGSQIDAGEAIGLGGNTGNSTGPHLHFETRMFGIALDPMNLFDFSNYSTL